MLFQKIGRIAICLLIVLFAIGCEKMTDEIVNGTDSPDDDSVSVTPDDFPSDDDTTLVGDVVILTGDEEVDDIDQYGGAIFDFNSATIKGDTLTLAVSYSGGCKTHIFTLAAEPDFIPEFTDDGPGIGIGFFHHNNDDMCERWVEESYNFDLTPIKKKYQAEYNQDAGVINLLLVADPTVTFPQGPPLPTDLIYKFTE